MNILEKGLRTTLDMSSPERSLDGLHIYQRFEHEEDVLVIVHVHRFTGVTQIFATVRTSKPYAPYTRHTVVTDGGAVVYVP